MYACVCACMYARIADTLAQTDDEEEQRQQRLIRRLPPLQVEDGVVVEDEPDEDVLGVRN